MKIKIGDIQLWTDDYGHTFNLMFPKGLCVVNEKSGKVHVKLTEAEADKLSKYMARTN